MPPVDIDAHLSELAAEMDRLKVLYEQYFLGMEKQAPAVARKEVEKRLAFLGGQNIGNTALRFRYLGLVRRWKLYAERWDRVLREIENGTYSPHLARAKRRQGQEGGVMPSSSPSSSSARLTPPGDGPTALPPPPAAPASSPSLAPPNLVPKAAVPGMNEGELRALHQRYVDALRSVGDPRPVRYESMVASLTRQVPDILQKNQCDLVSFNVAVKDGKVVFRATPRRVVRAGEDKPAGG